MNELIQIDTTNADRPTVSGRELHEKLDVSTPYDKWMPRMIEYGFTEGKDFSTFLSKSTGGRPATDHQLTISMAKEICMIQRSEKGRMFRQYFIQVEEAWNKPEAVMARALQLANRTLDNIRKENSKLIVQNETMRPKAEYFDDLVDRNMLSSIRDTAKQLKVKEKQFVSFLIEKGYLYRDKKGKLTPKAGKGDGLFETKESKNEKTGWAGVQTLVTPKGRETFRLLTEGMRYE